MYSSYFASQGISAQANSPAKMDDIESSCNNNEANYTDSQLVSPVKTEDMKMEEYLDAHPVDYLHAPWMDVPIKLEENAHPVSPTKAEDTETLSQYHLMNDNVANALLDATIQANGNLQRQVNEAHQEIERLRNQQEQDRLLINQLTGKVAHEENNKEWYIQQAVQEERAHQQGIVNDILVGIHQGAEFFPKQLIQGDDGGIENLVLTELLAKGGYGHVYRSVRVDDQGKHVPCALKVVDSGDYQIEREVDILMQISHENIVACYGTILDEPNRRLGIIMELGTIDLFDRHHEQGTTLEELREISIGVLNALRYLHSQGIAHLDVKPENIMIMTEYGCPLRECDVKLCDFGLSETRDTLTGGKGTDCFMAPEMVFHHPYKATTADMWSFGATIMALLLRWFPPNWNKAYEEGFYDFGDPTRQVFFDGIQACIQSLGASYYEKMIRPEKRPFLELIRQTLVLDPQKRISAAQALRCHSCWLGKH